MNGVTSLVFGFLSSWTGTIESIELTHIPWAKESACSIGQMRLVRWARPVVRSARAARWLHADPGSLILSRRLSTGSTDQFPRGVAAHGPRSAPPFDPPASSDPGAQWRVYVGARTDPLGPSGAGSNPPAGPLASLERAWTTDFGSIRFDSANQPQCHGQQDLFESVQSGPTNQEGDALAAVHPEPSRLEPTGGLVSPARTPSDHAQDRNFWFENDDSLTRPDVGRALPVPSHSPGASSALESQATPSSPRIFQPLAAVPPTAPPPRPVTSTLKPDLGGVASPETEPDPESSVAPASVNIFDEQYFPPVSTELPSPEALPSRTPLRSEAERATDLHLVDEQYFGSVPMIDSVVSTDESDTQAMRQLVHDATRNLSWVDQQLFPLPTSPPVPENVPAPPARRRPSARKSLAKSTALAFVETLRKHPEQLESFPPDGDRLWNDSLMKRLSSAAQVKEAGEALAVMAQDDTTQEPPGKKLGSKLNARFKPPDLEALGSLDIIELLKCSVIFDSHDIVAINKPYGLEMYHKGGSSFHALDKYLPDLAKHLDVPELLLVHRLDKKTTGVLLLAKSKLMHSTLTDLFRQRKIDKRYWAIAKGMAEPSEGIINIPLGETCLDKRFRMTVRPLYSHSDVMTGLKNPKGQVLPAVTEYRVLSLKHRMQLIEAKPITGFRHQIRAHLSLGIQSPILGDHVYDKVDSVGKPQRLPPYALEKLGIRASAARQMPLCLHAKHIQIPEIVPNKNVWVDAAMPHYFNRIMSKLNLKPFRHVKI